MLQREKAIKTIDGRQIEAPEVSRPHHFEVGDVVQFKADGKRAAGQIGVIIGERFYTHNRGEYLAYRIKLSDRDSIETDGGRIRFLRHGDGTAADLTADGTDAAEI